MEKIFDIIEILLYIGMLIILIAATCYSTIMFLTNFTEPAWLIAALLGYKVIAD